MMGSFERYLKSKNYVCSIISDPEFAKLTSVLKTKQNILKSEGMGNLPRRAESLSDQHINKLWECNQLGPNNPESILNTLLWNNTTHFVIRSVKPHVDMKWGDVTLHCDSYGNEFLQFQERQSKTCQVDNPVSVRDVHPKPGLPTMHGAPSRCTNCMLPSDHLIIPRRIPLSTLQQIQKFHQTSFHGLSACQ